MHPLAVSGSKGARGRCPTSPSTDPASGLQDGPLSFSTCDPQCRYGNLILRSEDGAHYLGHRYPHTSARRLGTTQVGLHKDGNSGG